MLPVGASEFFLFLFFSLFSTLDLLMSTTSLSVFRSMISPIGIIFPNFFRLGDMLSFNNLVPFEMLECFLDLSTVIAPFEMLECFLDLSMVIAPFEMLECFLDLSTVIAPFEMLECFLDLSMVIAPFEMLECFLDLST